MSNNFFKDLAGKLDQVKSIVTAADQISTSLQKLMPNPTQPDQTQRNPDKRVEPAKQPNISGHRSTNAPKTQRRRIPLSVRYDVFKRDGYRCCICGTSSKNGARLEVDHIIAVSRGGTDNLKNLRTLCFECNRGKSNKTV